MATDCYLALYYFGAGAGAEKQEEWWKSDIASHTVCMDHSISGIHCYSSIQSSSTTADSQCSVLFLRIPSSLLPKKISQFAPVLGLYYIKKRILKVLGLLYIKKQILETLPFFKSYFDTPSSVGRFVRLI